MTAQAHTVEWHVHIASLAYAFFSPSSNKAMAEATGKPVTSGVYTR